MTTYKECELVQDELVDLLMYGKHKQRAVNGVGISKSESNNWYFRVNLEKELNKRKRAKLPTDWKGIHIEYQVVGKIRACSRPIGIMLNRKPGSLRCGRKSS
jgi:hypothetical protein